MPGTVRPRSVPSFALPRLTPRGLRNACAVVVIGLMLLVLLDTPAESVGTAAFLAGFALLVLKPSSGLRADALHPDGMGEGADSSAGADAWSSDGGSDGGGSGGDGGSSD